MKKTVMKNFFASVRKDDEQADVFAIVHESNGNIATSILGDANNIAKSLFTMIMDSDRKEMSDLVYGIIRNVAYNIIANPSDKAQDLLGIISELAEEAPEHHAITLPIRGEA